MGGRQHRPDVQVADAGAGHRPAGGAAVQFRRDGGELPRAGRGPHRGRRGPAAHRDGVRRAECQGGAVCGGDSAGRIPCHRVGECGRQEREDTDGADAGGVLYRRQALSAGGFRRELFARGRRAPAAGEGHRVLQRRAGDLLPERRPAQRAGRIRPDAGADGRRDGPVRRAPEHRGRLLRHHAGPYPSHSGPLPRPAQRDAQGAESQRSRSLSHRHQEAELHPHRRTDERRRQPEVRAPGRRRRL